LDTEFLKIIRKDSHVRIESGLLRQNFNYRAGNRNWNHSVRVLRQYCEQNEKPDKAAEENFERFDQWAKTVLREGPRLTDKAGEPYTAFVGKTPNGKICALDVTAKATRDPYYLALAIGPLNSTGNDVEDDLDKSQFIGVSSACPIGAKNDGSENQIPCPQ